MATNKKSEITLLAMIHFAEEALKTEGFPLDFTNT
jgi:hypothetical protein